MDWRYQMANKRDIGLSFKISEHEHDLIKQKMALFSTKSQSEYLRKITFDGCLIRLEFEQFQEMLSIMWRKYIYAEQDGRCHPALWNF
jgi:hypothetical protein